MKILAFLRNHARYWGIPHPRNNAGSRLVQTCYECAAERAIKIELRPSFVEDIVAPLLDDHLAA